MSWLAVLMRHQRHNGGNNDAQPSAVSGQYLRCLLSTKAACHLINYSFENGDAARRRPLSLSLALGAHLRPIRI